MFIDSTLLNTPRLSDFRNFEKSTLTHATVEPRRVVAIGDTVISEQGLVAIIGATRVTMFCGASHTFEEANKLVRQHRPDVLLIEPFLENRDAIRWIKDLATEFPRIRILIVSRQSELTYAERAFRAGSAEELMRAVDTVTAGELYASLAITALAMQRFARRGDLSSGVDALSDHELRCFR